MSYGVTPQGFIRKNRDQLVFDMHENLKSLYPDQDIDLSEGSEDWIRIQAQADELDRLWQVAEDIYYANFIPTATGINLDRVVIEGGVGRGLPKRAIVMLRFQGVTGSAIESGKFCSTAQNIKFITIGSGVIGEDGFGSVIAQAVQFGPSGNVAANSINQIDSSMPGITSVTNLEEASQGRIQETDSELVSRYRARGSTGGSSAVALQSILNNAQSIILARVYENATKFTDEEGRPGNSMEAVIEGGAPDVIGDIFLKNWPGGIESFGTDSVRIVDNQGIPRTYFFSRPTELEVFVKVLIRTKDGWLSSNESIVKTNCIKIIGGIDTIGSNSQSYSGKGLGVEVESWELKAAQLGVEEYDTVQVLGIREIDFLLGTTEPPLLNRLVPTGRQRLKLVTANITVEYL